jgi:hypothetical protein
MKNFIKAIRLLLLLALIGAGAFLWAYVSHPVGQASAATDNVIPLTDTCDKVGGCDQDPCSVPRDGQCPSGCVLNSDQVCVPDDSSDDPTPPQVLGASTTVTTPQVLAETTGK